MAEDKKSKGVCRDFERGVCNRGNKCKFYHPEGTSFSEGKLPICKDFQNKGCDRIKCKFLHITQDEEADYNSTGVLPEHGGRPDRVRGGGGGGGGGGNFGGNQNKDVCKDFLNNICQRGNKCRFRHVTEREYRLEQQLESMGGSMGGGASGGAPTSMYGKRRRDDFGGGMGPDMTTIMDENEMLRRKITDLQRQVVDLRQMNDTLYDQNTRYRNQLRGSTAGSSAMDPYVKAVSYPSMAPPPDMGRGAYDGYTKF